jgi:DnaJ-class molecular chaperone
MATRKPARRTPAVVTCPDCDGTGETTETVRVGARKGRATDHRQAAVCLTCLGYGEQPQGG